MWEVLMGIEFIIHPGIFMMHWISLRMDMVSLNSLADYHQSLIGCLVMPERPYLNQKHIGVRCKWILERRTGLEASHLHGSLR